jgi:glycosyltransferase involved in cell wall biosynthesis
LEEGIPNKKIKVVPLAYERPKAVVTFKREYPTIFTPSRPLRVLFLGQINLRKGVWPVLDAIRLLRGEPIEFWFVGSIQLSIPSDLRNDPQVHWVGSVAHQHTDRFYRNADIFLFPTFSDGFGLTQLEAQAWNLPVIATKFCGSVVDDGRNGWILPDVTPCTIAATIRRCRSDPARLQELSRNSGLAKQFALARIGEQWLHVLE